MGKNGLLIPLPVWKFINYLAKLTVRFEITRINLFGENKWVLGLTSLSYSLSFLIFFSHKMFLNILNNKSKLFKTLVLNVSSPFLGLGIRITWSINQSFLHPFNNKILNFKRNRKAEECTFYYSYNFNSWTF